MSRKSSVATTETVTIADRGSPERESAELGFAVDLAPLNPNHLKIDNPVMIASGTFGYDGYGRGITPEMDLGRLGAVLPKTVSTSNAILNCLLYFHYNCDP